MTAVPPPRRMGPAFLLAQLGAHAAARFAEQLQPLGLEPPLAGILFHLRAQPDMTQKALAERLGAFPSRLVAWIDALSERGLVERHPHPEDRRSHVLRLTAAGRRTLTQVGKRAQDQERALLAPLSEREQAQLLTLLQKVAAHAGMQPAVHPGFRRKPD